MEATEREEVKDMDFPADFDFDDDILAEIECRIADMEDAAEAGDPFAINALANGYAERMRMTEW